MFDQAGLPRHIRRQYYQHQAGLRGRMPKQCETPPESLKMPPLNVDDVLSVCMK